LIEACLVQAQNLKCFVNVATSSVYGKNATDSEDSPAKPTSHYGVTKLAAEQLVLAANREKSLPACSLRLFSVYGPRERPDKLYPRLIAATLDKTPFPLHKGSEHHSRSFTYIDDIISGFLRIIAVPESWKGEIFNIGSDSEITTNEGIRIVSELCGQDVRIEYKPPRNGDQLRTSALIKKAQLMLDYTPMISIREGLGRQIEWMKKERQQSSRRQL
jgi:nucleoside-diphosphate-sugar epimerase